MNIKYLIPSLLLFLLSACSTQHVRPANNENTFTILYADRIFDGENLLKEMAVVVHNGKIIQVGKRDAVQVEDATYLDFGNSTLLPGFIESHAHLTYKQVPEHIVLRHGITTLRDLGGPILPTNERPGNLRILSSGKLLTAPGGYPIPLMGKENIAIEIHSEQQAREVVRELISQGAEMIKVALEPGGEPGAPWSRHHHKSKHHSSHTVSHKWPLLPLPIVKAIVDEAHKHNKIVSAHIGEADGARISLEAGVDEWAHAPCQVLPAQLLKRASKSVTIISTIDTLSHCQGIKQNIHKLSHYGASFIYGAEIAHPDIPWGIDAQELIYLKNYTTMSSLQVLASATSKAAKHIKRADLGVIKEGAIADLIVVEGNPIENFKHLEYPTFVMSGGKVVTNNLKGYVLESCCGALPSASSKHNFGVITDW